MSGPGDRRKDDHGGDSVPHDAWLREALRHAPDADAAPPPALSEVILRQARAAAAAAAADERPPVWPASPSLGARLFAAWAWLGRPPVAAGFASVMVAGVAGLMWWDRPLEESLPPRDAAIAAAAPAATPASQVAAVAPEPAPAPVPAPAPTMQAEAPAAAPPPPPASPSPQTAVARRQGPAPAPARPAAADNAAVPPPVALQPPAPMLADAAPGGAAAESERRAAAAVREERDERSRAVAALSKAAPAAAAPAPALRRDAATAVAGAASTSPLATLRTAIAAQPDRWRWQREAGSARAVESVLQQWLARAEATAGPRWSAVAVDATATGGDGIAVQFWFDERLHTTLRLDADGLVVEPAGGPRRRADLSAADAAALRDALALATR